MSSIDLSGAVVAYLAKQFKANKPVQEFFADFSEATVDWLRPIFLRDEEEPETAVKKLMSNPDSTAKQEALKALLVSELEDRPELMEHLRQLVQQIQAKSGHESAHPGSQNVGNSSSGNILMQDFKAGGSINVNVNSPKDENQD